MSFLKDYLFYNSGNECPRNYHIWGAFAVLSSVISRRVYLDMQYFLVHPNIYVCLVGEQGGRKTVAKDIAYDLLRECAPEIPVSAESTSKEALTQFMAAEPQLRTYRDDKDQLVEYRPLTLFSTELKNFLSINPITMIDFLTTIYDRKFYDVKTKNKGEDSIVNPYVVFLSCETPEWIVNRLKEAVISGGFSRRMIWVYEMGYERIAKPQIPEGGQAAWNRVKIRLRELKNIKGKFTLSPDADAFYVKWYEGLKLPTDALMRGWYNAKHIQALKISMLLSLCESNSLLIERAHFEAALTLLDSLEPNLVKLSSGVGRNVLAPHINKIVDILRAAPEGYIPEKKLMQIMQPNMNVEEFYGALKYLKDTDQVREGDLTVGQVKRKVIMTPEAYAKIDAAQRANEKTPPAK